MGPKNLGQILEKVQNGLKRLAKISKKSENLFKFPPCFARISPNIDLINLKPFPIDFYGQFASKWDPVSKIPFLLPPCHIHLQSNQPFCSFSLCLKTFSSCGASYASVVCHGTCTFTQVWLKKYYKGKRPSRCCFILSLNPSQDCLCSTQPSPSAAKS